MVTQRTHGPHDHKFTFWFVARADVGAQDGEPVKHDGTQTDSENFDSVFLEPDAAVKRLTFESDRDVVRKAIELVRQTHFPGTSRPSSASDHFLAFLLTTSACLCRCSPVQWRWSRQWPGAGAGRPSKDVTFLPAGSARTIHFDQNLSLTLSHVHYTPIEHIPSCCTTAHVAYFTPSTGISRCISTRQISTCIHPRGIPI